VFVPSSKKNDNLPKALQGQISLEHLRQIYTGRITNWQQLGGPNLPIKPFAPNEPEAERLFQKLVFNDDQQQIALYEKTVTRQPTERTQEQIVTEFNEGQAGIISYGILSRTWDQCAGYPLALVDANNHASQALFRLSGQPIDPSDNLCDKDNRLDVHTFATGSYPLGYPLFVVYPKDNRLPPAGRKFAELLITRQGQCLLSKAGLVPLQPVPEKYLNSNGCKSVP
jgi:ABC-type phosphate transport system substrate-binding protein